MPVTSGDLIEAMRRGLAFDGRRFVPGRSALIPFQPPILQASFEGAASIGPHPHLTPHDFEALADSARRILLDEAEAAEVAAMPTLKVGELVAAISEAIAWLTPPAGLAPGPSELLAMRAGLQIIGCRIVPDDGQAMLRLSNVSMPFSLRLIGCVIEPPISLNSAELVTLELSGSAVAALDATFLTARGSVRLRRCYLNAPADFAGARIHGYFDASDIVMKPFGSPPANQSLDGDRGMLNLSQARIDNEIRLTRATIWGGLSMRGLQTQRSIHVDEAVILAPLAVLEAMVTLALESDQDAMLDRLRDATLPPVPTRPAKYQVGLQAMQARARAVGTARYVARGDLGWQNTTLALLLGDTLRVRTSAVRADGMHIAGSIFAKHLSCHGRLRLKYVMVSGGMSLQGSKLRSVEALRRGFDDMASVIGENGKIKSPLPPSGSAVSPGRRAARQIGWFRQKSYEAVVSKAEYQADMLAFGADDFALDIRESRFGGSVRIGTPGNETLQHATVIDGVVSADRAHIDGELLLDAIAFQWSVRIRDTHPRLRNPEDRPGLDAFYKRCDVSWRRYSCEFHHNLQIGQGRRHQFDARNITVTDTISLARCDGLRGASFRNATIGGDLQTWTDLVPGAADDVVIVSPALAMTGYVDLIGAEIAGDCLLLFDPVRGPSIDAEVARIGGKLAITGAPETARGRLPFKAENVRDIGSQTRIDWLAAERAAGGPTGGDSLAAEAGWKSWMRANAKLPKIDLRNARATVFLHMPPGWPRFGRLDILGFRYDRSTPWGPLAPHPFGRADRLTSSASASVVCKINTWRTAASWLMLAGATIAGYGFAAVSRTGFRGAPGAGALILLGVCVVLAGVYALLPRIKRPYHEQSQPMAIEWLRLQGVARNDYRTQGTMLPNGFGLWTGARRRGKVYHSLEPYGVAARALREEGRWISANLVEERRLRVRTGQLSLRLHIFQKLLFRAADHLVRYGFSYVRLGLLTGALVCVTALGAQWANASGAIDHRLYHVQPEPAFGESLLRSGPSSSAGRCGPYGCADFVPLGFAIDTVLPTVDVGEAEKWDVNSDAIAFRMPPITVYWWWVFVVARGLGLLAVAVLALGVTSRLGLLIGRYAD